MVNDILIVGAGLSGVEAALYAAKGGAKVLVIEKNKKIGDSGKLCAGGFPSHFFKDYHIKPSNKFILNIPNKLNMFTPVYKKTKIFPKLKKQVYETEKIGISLKHIKPYIINKTKLIEMIAKKAVDEGAKIKTGVTYKGRHKGKVIIGADGMNSTVGRISGLTPDLDPNDIAICSQYEIENHCIDKDTMELFLGDCVEDNGYAWVFPTGRNKARVGLGVMASSKLNTKRLLDHFIEIYYPHSKKSSYVAGVLPSALPLNKLVKDNIMLTGDAARLTLALTGAGNGFASLSGKYAGKVAAEYINGDVEDLSSYERIIKSKIFKKLENSYKIKEKVCGDREETIKLMRKIKPALFLHKFFPRLIERYAFKNTRF